MMPDIYLDGEGVILAGGRPANYARQFLKYIVPNFPTYLLVSDAKDKRTLTIERLSMKFEPEIAALIKTIKPTKWDVFRTEAIDLNRPFLWFCKSLDEPEREILSDYGILKNWIAIDLNADENRLADFLLKFPRPVGYEF
jgi:hypothetical protein